MFLVDVSHIDKKLEHIYSFKYYMSTYLGVAQGVHYFCGRQKTLVAYNHTRAETSGVGSS